MKNTIIIILMFFKFVILAQPYEFTVLEGEYNALENAESLNKGLTWDNPAFKIPIGFSFQYFTSTTDTLYFNENFDLAALTIENTNNAITPILLFFGVDIIDRGIKAIWEEGEEGSKSPISYQTVGNVGSRILKIEWTNVGFLYEFQPDGISSDWINFQVWIYEGSNRIEIRFGEFSITQPQLCYDFGGPAIALMPSYDIDNDEFLAEVMFLSGNPSDPQVVFVDITELEIYNLQGSIPYGTIYRFNNLATDVNDLDFEVNEKLSLYPNPSNLEINIESEKAINTIKLYDLRGVLLQSKKEDEIKKIKIDELNSGMYILELFFENDKIVRRKIFKN